LRTQLRVSERFRDYWLCNRNRCVSDRLEPVAGIEKRYRSRDAGSLRHVGSAPRNTQAHTSIQSLHDDPVANHLRRHRSHGRHRLRWCKRIEKGNNSKWLSSCDDHRNRRRDHTERALDHQLQLTSSSQRNNNEQRLSIRIGSIPKRMQSLCSTCLHLIRIQISRFALQNEYVKGLYRMRF